MGYFLNFLDHQEIIFILSDFINLFEFFILSFIVLSEEIDNCKYNFTIQIESFYDIISMLIEKLLLALIVYFHLVTAQS